MITVYKKVEKNTKFLTGTENIQGCLNKDKPFLLCIGHDNKSNFDLLQKSLIISRVYNSNDNGTLFMLDDMPIDFISCALNDDKEYDELVNNYLYPFLFANGNNVDSIKAQAKKMNFLTFSALGCENYTNIENKINDLLELNKLSSDDIDDIFSQVSLISLGSPAKSSTNTATSIYFIDVNDSSCTYGNNVLKASLKASNLNNVCGTLNKNYLYLFEGDGNNTLDNYVQINNPVFSRICSAVSYFLENSISDKELDSTSLISSIPGFEQGSSLTLEDVDKNLSYNGTKKYNNDSLSIRNELDLACNQIVSQQANVLDQNLNRVLHEIKERCSDTVYYQILASIGVIDNPDKTIMTKKTDREIISGILDIFDIPTNNFDDDNPKMKTKKEL